MLLRISTASPLSLLLTAAAGPAVLLLLLLPAGWSSQGVGSSLLLGYGVTAAAARGVAGIFGSVDIFAEQAGQ
jgi:hypothetical protein